MTRAVVDFPQPDSPQITIPANSLPSGLRPTSAIVTNDGLRLSLAGSRVNLGQL